MAFIKRIDSYSFKNFIGLFFVTFFICLFIVVMQFLWLHINDLVGKGVPFDVLIEFFFYAALTSTPLALPLAILLASLMSFGNLGERLELLAMKSAGVSLFRIMRSLFIFISFVVIGAFFFSNNVIPIAQKKMWTLLFSFRQNSPELEIPVGEFYSGIKGMNIYVRSKEHDTKALLNVMIYDYTGGFDNASVTTADTARISLTEDKMNLVLSLSNGEFFGNLEERQTAKKDHISYRREEFKTKELLIDFDANFKMMDESLLSGQHVSKNIVQLTHDIDSIEITRDSLRTSFLSVIMTDKYFTKAYEPTEKELKDTIPIGVSSVTLHADSLFFAASQEQQVTIAQNAASRIESLASDMQYHKIIISNADSYYAQHNIEWHKKFTLSFACLIFFFIGAPLGAIIGKGGLGMPAVISVVLFVIYYIVDTFGKKMAREGLWEIWQGMWLSSFILLPIGIFFTYKAATDSQLFNPEAYKKAWSSTKNFFQRVFKAKNRH